MPLLVLEGSGVCFITMAWLRSLMLSGESAEELWKSAEAIGRLYDYYRLVLDSQTLSADTAYTLVAKFFEARKNGSAILGWDSVRNKTASDEVRRINSFSDFAEQNYGFISLNPARKVAIADLPHPERMLLATKMAARQQWDVLFHLVPTTDEGKGHVQRRRFEPPKEARIPSQGVSFPLPSIRPFFANIMLVRDKLLFLLTFFGGVRISEPHHMFVGDISIRADGSARVIIAHPSDSKYEWVSHAGIRQSGSRATFLRNKYGLGPRNSLGRKNPMHVGFKAMSWDNEIRLEAEVQWLIPGVGRLFAKLHVEYMRTIRAHLPDTHPYYLVTTEGDTFGEPLKLQNSHNTFVKTAKRAGLTPYRDGVNPHGGRHFYGQFSANYLGLSIQVTQMNLHHCSVTSTGCYYRISKEHANKAMKNGFQNMLTAHPKEVQYLISFIKGE